MREEFMKIYGIKDSNTRVWKMRQSILGNKHKAPKPACIQHPELGELVATPEETKTKNTVTPQDTLLVASKKNLHN